MNVRRLTPATLCALAGMLVFANASALAATNNVYRSQFNGSETAARSFAPGGLTVNSSRDVYVVDAEHGVVDEFGPSGTGPPLAEFKASETAEKSFDAEKAGDIAVNASGDVYVIDGSHNVVDEFNPGGTAVLAEFNGGETAASSFSAEGIAVNADEDVYVADGAHEVVDEFSPFASGEAAPLAQFNGGKTAGGTFHPASVAVNAGGDVYVGDTTNDVVDKFIPSANGEPTPLAELNGGTTPQGSFEPLRISAAANGEVYVASEQFVFNCFCERASVDSFSSSGTYEAQFEGGATPQSLIEAGGDLAVAPGGEVYVDGASGYVDLFSEPVTVPTVTTGPAEDQEVASATLTGSIEPATGLEATCEFRYGTTLSYGASAPCVPAGPFSSLNAVTADLVGLQPGTTYHYRLEGTTSNGTTPGADATFTTLEKVVSFPTVSIEPVAVSGIGEHSATFAGEVNPNEAPTTYHFEYSTDGVSWTALQEESAGEGTSAVPVTQTVTGLTGLTPYRVRLVAVNVCGAGTSGCGASTSSEETFSTLAGPPQVSGTGATDITAGEATLRATIHPENEPTTYRFEYGPTPAYGTIVPAGEGKLGASSTPTQVSQTITELPPNTTYHFRVVASTGVGAPTASADQTFTTFSSAGAAGCPNEQVRKESAVNPETERPFSLQLPECRAYEMVSPALKNGAPIGNLTRRPFFSASYVGTIGPEGSTVLINSTGIWPGTEQPANNDELASLAAEGEQYRVTRGASGWNFVPQVPSASQLRTYARFVSPLSTDIGREGIWSGAGLSPDEYPIVAETEDPNFYLLELGGTLAEIGPSVPPVDLHTAGQKSGKVDSWGASADLSRMLFSMPRLRWAFDQTKIPSEGFGEILPLYEYVGTGHTGEDGDVPSLVGVDNAGALISQCGTGAGGYPEESDEPEDRAISRAGSTVFFTSRAANPACIEEGSSVEGSGPVVNQVFARVGEPGPGAAVGSAVTVNVAGASSAACETSDACGITEAVKYQGASTDGSKVFFATEQPLVAGDTDSTENLYECKLPGDAGAPLTRIAPVNPCPDLVRVSIPESGTSAGVQSVAAVAADGSHVYFIATGVLSGENAELNSPTAGQDNLYVWQEPSATYPQGHTAFIATLSSTAFEQGEVQATPDGQQLVFTSSADLTPDDTSTVSQVFLYEAQHEALIRISKGQNGFNDDGNTMTDPASIASGEERKTISEDGSTVVFESSDALTAQVHGGAHNVYLWRGGNVSLISDGTPAGADQSAANGAGLQPPNHAGLIGIDGSGQDVFFTTEARLVGQDSDVLSDLYDARVDGGFPAPTNDECSGEACQGTSPASLAPVTPGSLSPSGAGNLNPPPMKSMLPARTKVLTSAEKLAKALKACRRDRTEKKRAQCEAAARKRYGARKPSTHGAKRGRKTGKTPAKGDR